MKAGLNGTVMSKIKAIEDCSLYIFLENDTIYKTISSAENTRLIRLNVKYHKYITFQTFALDIGTHRHYVQLHI